MFKRICDTITKSGPTFRPDGGGRALLSLLAVAFCLTLLPGNSYADGAQLKVADKQISQKKFKLAIRTLTKAMNSGNLTDTEMAKALYLRGAAYSEQGRHSAAIADLTGAIWLKKLTSGDRKKALARRAMSYQATGLGKLARIDLKRAGAVAKNRTARSSTGQTGAARSLPPIPTFKTTVRASKKAAAKKVTKTATKAPIRAKAPEKPVIPAFRTSIATE